MAKTLYEVFIRLYPLAIKIASAFNEKAKLWIEGRKRVFERMEEAIGQDDRIIWMHCSSLGEFEQGRPVLEKLKKYYPSFKILLTFFSPSGYEVRKNYDGADYIFYLPPDSSGNAKRLYDITGPALVIFVKYEFWYYYLREAKRRNVPLLLISAIFRKTQPFFSGRTSFYRSMLSYFTHLFVQNPESVSLLQSIGYSENVSLAGDTRFDRVIEIAEKFQAIPLIEKFCSNSKVIVAGSTWLEDDKELAHYANTKTDVKFIIAPHNIRKERLNECTQLYKHSALFSAFKSTSHTANINTIIIDNIGILSVLYKYSTISYIGGGFGAEGVHNVLEAAVYGKPVVFGPKYEKFNEAIELIDGGGAVSINNTLELEACFDRLLDNCSYYTAMSTAARNYVYDNGGSTEKILRFIHENRLLTN